MGKGNNSQKKETKKPAKDAKKGKGTVISSSTDKAKK